MQLTDTIDFHDIVEMFQAHSCELFTSSLGTEILSLKMGGERMMYIKLSKKVHLFKKEHDRIYELIKGFVIYWGTSKNGSIWLTYSLKPPSNLVVLKVSKGEISQLLSDRVFFKTTLYKIGKSNPIISFEFSYKAIPPDFDPDFYVSCCIQKNDEKQLMFRFYIVDYEKFDLEDALQKNTDWYVTYKESDPLNGNIWFARFETVNGYLELNKAQ